MGSDIWVLIFILFILLLTFSLGLLALAISSLVLALFSRSDTRKVLEGKRIFIPSTLLHEAFSKLLKHGLKGKEWILLLGAHEFDRDLVVTHLFDPGCSFSGSTRAVGNPDGIFKAYDFYELCGARIVGAIHLHPWNSESVGPSWIDLKYQRKWEEAFGGEFIGIVFNNSGVFRIFTAGKSRLKPVLLGRGFEKKGRDLYVLL